MIQIDMEMPKSCYECLLSQNCFGTLICDVTKKRANKHNCPLKEVNECKAEDCRSLNDIKEMIEKKAEELDGKMFDAGGICIGLYFAIANELPSVYPKSDNSVLEDIKDEDCISKIVDVLGGYTDLDIPRMEDIAKDIMTALPSVYPKSDKSCDDCMWSVCNYNKSVDYNKLLEDAIDKVEDYVCNHETDTAKAQGMCDALTMIEEYIREQSE